MLAALLATIHNSRSSLDASLFQQDTTPNSPNSNHPPQQPGTKTERSQPGTQQISPALSATAPRSHGQRTPCSPASRHEAQTPSPSTLARQFAPTQWTEMPAYLRDHVAYNHAPITGMDRALRHSPAGRVSSTPHSSSVWCANSEYSKRASSPNIRNWLRRKPKRPTTAASPHGSQ